MAVLLYYPLVRPPVEVLHQSLLYWDGIATVVPREEAVYQAAVSEELEELRERGLYTPLTLGMAESVFRFSDSNREPSSRVLRRELRRMATSPDVLRLRSRRDAYMYTSKIACWLDEELIALGFGERIDDRYWRLVVPEEVQQLVIGTLAREIAAESRISCFPYTDHEQAQAFSVRVPEPIRAWERGSEIQAWEVEIGRLLPVPAPGTTTAAVLDFRDRYADERQRLMRALHRLLGDLRRNYSHPADVVDQMRHEIEESVADYRAAAKRSRLAWVTRSVTVTIAVATAALSSLQPGMSWLLGAVGGYALNVATREIRPLATNRDQHDFSYLHKVEKTL